jgi:hypothetical protein
MSWYAKWSDGTSEWEIQHIEGHPPASPVNVVVPNNGASEGQLNNVVAPQLNIVTSEAEIVIELEDTDPGNAIPLGITSVLYQAREALSGKRLKVRKTSVSSPGNPMTILVRGEPGTYSRRASAVVTDTRGGSTTIPLEIVLGLPESTSTGSDIMQDFSDESGGNVGSVTFANVATGGQTTMSTSTDGPIAPTGFKVIGDTVPQYFDIRSSAGFDEATVCFGYDDAPFGGDILRESALRIHHYKCTDEAGTSCAWEDITSPESLHGNPNPNIDTDTICGVTDSFSIFALTEPDVDDDGDGVNNDEDNCPQSANDDQSDLDGDDIGDACDSDVDGDGFTDDEDTCPLWPSDNNNDLDGDGDGDICDSDDDGDGYNDENDNCPVVPNADQADFDGDFVGDQCDTDDDNDGVSDGNDMCQESPSGVELDENGCTSAQALVWKCPNDGDYRNHGQYMKCIVEEADRQVEVGLIADFQRGDVISEAAQKDVGKKSR